MEPYCADCGLSLHAQAEKAVGSGEWQMVWADSDGSWVCPHTGDEHKPAVS
jgi:hypothetical protein